MTYPSNTATIPKELVVDSLLSDFPRPILLEKKTVILTSFRDARNHNCPKYSIARWQPKGCTYSEIKSLAPKYSDGRPIVNLEPDRYRLMYEENVLKKVEVRRQLSALIELIDPNGSVALLCWCNLARQAEYPKLMCHRILVGYYIERYFPAVTVLYCDGAENPVWDR